MIQVTEEIVLDTQLFRKHLIHTAMTVLLSIREDLLSILTPIVSNPAIILVFNKANVVLVEWENQVMLDLKDHLVIMVETELLEKMVHQDQMHAPVTNQMIAVGALIVCNHPLVHQVFLELKEFVEILDNLVIMAWMAEKVNLDHLDKLVDLVH